MQICLAVNQRKRRILRWLDRSTHDADMRIRCRILLKISQGKSGNQAAAELGCAPSTTSRVAARFRERGIQSLFDGRRENGELKVDDDVRAGILKILERTAEEHGCPRTTWTLEVLSGVIERELGLSLSVGHLCKLLHAMGVRLGQPKPFVSCPWPAAKRAARIQRLRRLVNRVGPNEVVVFLDEVDIHLNPRIGRDWMLPGQRRWIRTPGKNVKRYLAGAFDPKRNCMVYVEGDRKASWLFLNLLRALRRVYRWAKTIHIILDNYAIHKSAVVQAGLKEIGDKIVLHFLPPYCPEENRIERIWKDLHDNVTRNHRCRTMSELLQTVRRWLDERFNTFRGACYGV